MRVRCSGIRSRATRRQASEVPIGLVRQEQPTKPELRPQPARGEGHKRNRARPFFEVVFARGCGIGSDASGIPRVKVEHRQG